MELFFEEYLQLVLFISLLFLCFLILFKISKHFFINKKCKTWEYWSDLDKWHINEASRLVICGPERLYKCLFRCKKKLTHCELLHDVKNIEKLYKISGMDDIIEPKKFIAWAKDKKTINIPKNIINLYDYEIDIKIDEVDDFNIISDAIVENKTNKLDTRSLLALALKGANLSFEAIYYGLAKDPKAQSDNIPRTVNGWCKHAKEIIETKKIRKE